MSQLECSVCHAMVDETDTTAHLATAHPAPPEGFLFVHNGERYHTVAPSLRVAEVIVLTGASPADQFYEEREGTLVPLAHGNAVDLTHGPRRFFSLPSARI